MTQSLFPSPGCDGRIDIDVCCLYEGGRGASGWSGSVKKWRGKRACFC